MQLSRFVGIAFSTVVLALLAACAGGGGAWEKPGIDDEAKAAEMLNCRDYARDRIGSRAVRQTEHEHSRAVAAEDTGRNDDMSALRRMEEADHLRLERRFFDECMRANGYRRASDS